jgi:hypothetical protein
LNEIPLCDSHFNVGLTGGAARAAGTLFASADCPFTADVELLTFPGGAQTLFAVELFDCGCASVEVTVVLETCRDPDDLRPLDDPEKAITSELIMKANKSSDYLNSVNFDCRAMKCAVAAVLSADCRCSLDFPAVVFLQ